jgi:hypothetical protein
VQSEILFVVKESLERVFVVVLVVSRSAEFYARCGSGSGFSEEPAVGV